MIRLVIGAAFLFAIVMGTIFFVAIAISLINRSKRGTSGALSTAALEVQSLLEPSKKNVVETMHEQDEREDDDDVV